MWSFPNIKSDNRKTESAFSQIEIEMPEGEFEKIKIDGHEIKGIESYELVHSTEDIPMLRLNVYAFETTIKADVIPTLPDHTYGSISFDKLIDAGIATYEQLIELNELEEQADEKI